MIAARWLFTVVALLDAVVVLLSYHELRSPLCLLGAVLFLLVAAGAWWFFRP